MPQKSGYRIRGASNFELLLTPLRLIFPWMLAMPFFWNFLTTIILNEEWNVIFYSCVFSLVHPVSMSVFLECFWSESIYECTRLNLWPLYSASFTVSCAYHVTNLKTCWSNSCIGAYPAFVRFTKCNVELSYNIHRTVPAFIRVFH